MPVLNGRALVEERVNAIRVAHKNAGIDRAELDISGGVDSWVMAGLLSLALGPDKVTLAHLGFKTDPAATGRARRAAAAFGCRIVVSDFSEVYEVILGTMMKDLRDAGYDILEIETRIANDSTVLGSIRSTLRAPLGRGYNRLTGGGIRHGTGNECEDRFLRFFQKGGDGEVDSNPIAFLSKNEVWQLAHAIGQYIGTSEAIASAEETIAATPSPDLWGVGAKHNDEDELVKATGAPFNYGRVDPKTGKATRIGNTERVSRYLDATNDALFDDNIRPGVLDAMIYDAQRHPAFRGLDADTVKTLLLAAKRMERSTRHKLNPNIPMFGDRKTCLKLDILTNDLEACGI